AAGVIFFFGAEPIANIACADEVQMICNRIDPLVGILAGFPVPPGFVVGSGNDMEQMRIDAVADEGIPIVVPVDAPRVGGAIGIGFPDMSRRMITVHAAVEANPLFLGSAGLAWHRPVGPPVGSIEPTVGPPGKTVGEIMGIGMISKSIEENLGL